MEDNSADVHLIREALSEHLSTYALTVLNDGEKAIRYIEEVDSGARPCPRLFIFDLNLPRKDGREVLRRLKLSPRCATVPIVILSSSGAEKDQAEAASLGATLYIQKPSNLDQFLTIGQTIRRLL